MPDVFVVFFVAVFLPEAFLAPVFLPGAFLAFAAGFLPLDAALGFAAAFFGLALPFSPAFFSTAEGWGLFRQKREGDRQRATLDVRYGRLRVRELVFALPGQAKPAKVGVTAAGKPPSVQYATKDGRLTITLATDVTVAAGQTLEIDIRR